MTPPRPPSGPAAGARLLWVVAAAVLLGALVLAGRLLDAAPGPAATRATRAAPTTTLPVPASGAVPAGLCDAAEPGACQDELLWFPMEAFVVPPDFTGAPGSLGALALCAGPTGARS